MTQEEMEAKILEQNARIEELNTTAAKVAELEAKLNPPAADPDEVYKPKTWKENDEKMDAKAEAAALRVLENAEKKKQEILEEEKKVTKKQEEQIESAFTKLQEEGLIAETKDGTDEGAKQRKQSLGLALRLGGIDVEASARALKTAWDAGLEYDYEKNSFSRRNSPTAFREAVVGSSANRTPAPAAKGTVNLRGVNGDLDEARRRWEEQNPA